MHIFDVTRWEPLNEPIFQSLQHLGGLSLSRRLIWRLILLVFTWREFKNRLEYILLGHCSFRIIVLYFTSLRLPINCWSIFLTLILVTLIRVSCVSLSFGWKQRLLIIEISFLDHVGSWVLLRQHIDHTIVHDGYLIDIIFYLVIQSNCTSLFLSIINVFILDDRFWFNLWFVHQFYFCSV